MFEKLENRRLLAATIVNPGANGVLTVDGSTGNNVIDLSVSSNHLVIVIDGVPQSFDLSDDHLDGEFHQLVVNGDLGNDQVTLSDDVASAPGSSGVTLNGDGGNDTILSGPGEDLINGGAGNDSIFGGNGSDTLDGGTGADTILGGDGVDDGTDTVTYASRSNPIFITVDDGPQVANDGEAGENDLIDSTVDVFDGGSGNDTMINETNGGKDFNGGDGADTLTGGDNNDNLAGGNGDDLLDGRDGDDAFDGGTGNDTLTYASRSSGVTVTLDGTGNDGENGESDNVLANVEIIIGTDSNDSISALGALAGHSLIGGLGGDTLVGGTVADTLVGGDGDDSVTGGAGADSLVGGIGNDTINGNDGNDTITTGDGADNVFGGAGNDSISGELGNDYLSGEDGNDTVSGGDGNDRILGGFGDDSLTGNDGNDEIAPGRGKDTLLGGTGADRADYSYESKAVVVSLDGAANDGIKAEGDNVATDIEDIRGGSSNDKLTGSGARNSLIGGAGNDTLSGGNGNDILSGEAGNDLLDGGKNTDRLRGGLGTDTIIGGAGTDTADYLGQNQNLNISLDGKANDGASGEKDWIKSDVENVQTAGGNDVITGSAGVNLIYSGAGNDTVTGGGGKDTLFGELGNDTFHTKDGVIDTIGDHIGTDVLDKDTNDIVV